MAIKENLRYNAKEDVVEGFEEMGEMGRTKYVANNALVFMVRSLTENWKQAVGYFLSSGPMKSDIIKSALLNCIDKVESVGLNVKVIICDQGSNNQSLVKSLGATEAKPTFLHNSSIYHIMYDPPHLFKNIRNNLKKSSFQIDENKILWKHVSDFYAVDSSMPIRMAPKLTKKHIDLPPFSSMRVCLAAQVLSHSVAAGITTLSVLSDKLDNNAINTAHFIEKFDSLFNVFNSANLNDAHKLRRPIKHDSDHVEFLKETLQWLQCVKPLNPGRSRSTLPCLEGWKLSVSCLLSLWNHLCYECGVDFLLTRKLNQDCLENFFSTIRGRGGHRDNPDAVQFLAEYRAMAVDALFQTSKQSNCAQDMDSFLLKLGNLNVQPHKDDDDETQALSSYVNDLLSISHAPPELNVTEENIATYIAGHIGKKTLTKFKCDNCEFRIRDSVISESDETHTFICQKQYSGVDNGLFVPSKIFCKFVARMEKIFRENIEIWSHNYNVKTMFMAAVTSVNETEKIFEICKSCEDSVLQINYMIHLFFYYTYPSPVA